MRSMTEGHSDINGEEFCDVFHHYLYEYFDDDFADEFDSDDHL